MTAGPRVLATAAGLVGAYTFGVRPRLLRWGATDEELSRPYPGADVIPGGKRAATTATTLDAPPSAVWPWLVQIGCDRGGWYSWDRRAKLRHPTTESMHPEPRRTAA